MRREATTIYLANGAVRTVLGSAEDIGAQLRRRQFVADDGLRELETTDGDWITVNVGGVLLAEPAKTRKTGTFGFAAALDAA